MDELPDWDDDGYGPGDDYDDCPHEDYEADWNGRAICFRCGHAWWQSPEEMAREIEHQRQYDEWCQREQRREWLAERWWGRAWIAVTAAIRARQP